MLNYLSIITYLLTKINHHFKIMIIRITIIKHQHNNCTCFVISHLCGIILVFLVEKLKLRQFNARHWNGIQTLIIPIWVQLMFFSLYCAKLVNENDSFCRMNATFSIAITVKHSSYHKLSYHLCPGNIDRSPDRKGRD